MKILLLGEFSGVHNNLKISLESIGHEVVTISNGDGYKNISSDFRLIISKYKIINILYFIFFINRFTGYDVVQFVSPFSLPSYFSILGLDRVIYMFNKKKIYYACGTDPAFLAAESNFEYFPFNKNHVVEYPNFTRLNLYQYNIFLKNIDSLIPSMYTYKTGYSGFNKLSKTIPLPGFLNRNNGYRAKIENRKINILLGITRPYFKGAKYMQKALSLIQNKYSNRVNITIVEKIDFSSYKKLLKETDILLDQCLTYDYGMNCILAGGLGCIVMTGNREVARIEISKYDSPIINITPDSKFIFNEIEKLIFNKDEIHLIQNKTIDYIKLIHSPYEIAKSFDSEYKIN